MHRTYGFLSAKDVFAKLQRDRDALYEEVTSDRFFNFVMTGYAVFDWITKDDDNPQTTRDSAKCLLDESIVLKACRDLANASKHFKLSESTKHPRVLSSATSEQGYGYGRYGKGDWGVGEESIHIELDDGTRYHCLDFVDEVLNTWQSFFDGHNL